MLHADAAVLQELLSLKNAFHNYDKDINQIRVFIERCVTRNKLKKWTIAIKEGGAAREIGEVDKDFPFAVTMTQRSGPKEDNNGYRTEFVRRRIFSVSGKSANIVSSGADLSILLSDDEIKSAKMEFEEERAEMLKKKDNITIEKAREQVKASGVTYPERIYREKMSDENGLLLIYLQDLQHVFRQENGGDQELKKMAEEGGFNLDIPLVGYALGFPPVFPDPGGEYAVGRYGIDEEEAEEFDEELKLEEE
jgi:ribosome-associated protein YbcJ (S4-like RNA binding protein)